MYKLITLTMIILSVVACNVVSGKPSTSAPRGIEDINDFWQACYDLEDEIDAWAEREKRQAEEDFADGDRTVVGAIVKQELIDDDALAMKRELRDNCNARADEYSEDSQTQAAAANDTPEPAEPTEIPDSTWTPFPTYTPEPTWTPEPSPTPTATPLPTPTMTLRELAIANAGVACIDAANRVEPNESTEEVLAEESGVALIKAGFYNVPPGQDFAGRTSYRNIETSPYYRYWRYDPGPVRGTFVCNEIMFT